MAGAELDHALLLEGFEGGALGSKMAGKVDLKALLDRLDGEGEIAHQLADDIGPEAVFWGEGAAALSGEAAGLDGLEVGVELALVLHIGVGDEANGREAEAEDIFGLNGRVAHEVAPQAALLLGQGQLIFGERVVIHADGDIAGGAQGLAGEGAQLKLGLWAR